jgi:DNA-binding CsgD family transcriptional regulator
MSPLRRDAGELHACTIADEATRAVMQDRASAIGLPRVVGALGERDFPQIFLKTLAETLDVDMCSAFALDRTGGMRMLFAAGWTTASNALAQSASSGYAKTFWRTDATLAESPDATMAPSVSCQRWDAIRDDRYRIACYENPGVMERLSVRVPADGGMTQVGLYRFHHHGAFKHADVRRLEQVGGLFAALAAKHGSLALQYAYRGALPDLPAVIDRLVEAAPDLSHREAEVCAAVLCGHSAKEAARILGVEPSSIVTYRKRAFLKLGVARSEDLVAFYKVVCPPP